MNRPTRALPFLNLFFTCCIAMIIVVVGIFSVRVITRRILAGRRAEMRSVTLLCLLGTVRVTRFLRQKRLRLLTVKCLLTWWGVVVSVVLVLLCARARGGAIQFVLLLCVVTGLSRRGSGLQLTCVSVVVCWVRLWALVTIVKIGRF